MVAKRFFYVCAGILCLALAYHLGAKSVAAQSGVVEAASLESMGLGNYAITFVVGRVFYGGNGLPDLMAIPAPVPGTARIVATGLWGPGYTAVLENGDTYVCADRSVGVWQFLGNALSGPTPATRETWGGVKARYRQGAGAATHDK